MLIQLKKFTLREDWVPIKLDVAVEIPDLLDLSPLRGAGPQPGEEPLPELAGNLPPPPAINEKDLKDLIDMGMLKTLVYFDYFMVVVFFCYRISTRSL